MRVACRSTLAVLTSACLLLSCTWAQAEGDFEQLTLRISPERQSVLALEPIPITITLSNNTDKVVQDPGPVAPNAGGLKIYDARGEGTFRRFRTADNWPVATLHMPEGAVFGPGRVRTASGYLYYANPEDAEKEVGRYLLPEPGTYRIKAVLRHLRSTETIESNIMTVVAREPTGVDARAYELLKALPYRSFLLTTTGTYRSPEGLAVVAAKQELLREFPETRYARYLHYSLGFTYLLRRGEELERGMEMLEKAASYEDFIFATKALWFLAETSVKQGDLDRAERYLAILKERFPDSPTTRSVSATISAVRSEQR